MSVLLEDVVVTRVQRERERKRGRAGPKYIPSSLSIPLSLSLSLLYFVVLRRLPFFAVSPPFFRRVVCNFPPIYQRVSTLFLFWKSYFSARPSCWKPEIAKLRGLFSFAWGFRRRRVEIAIISAFTVFIFKISVSMIILEFCKVFYFEFAKTLMISEQFPFSLFLYYYLCCSNHRVISDRTLARIQLV